MFHLAFRLGFQTRGSSLFVFEHGSLDARPSRFRPIAFSSTYVPERTISVSDRTLCGRVENSCVPMTTLQYGSAFPNIPDPACVGVTRLTGNTGDGSNEMEGEKKGKENGEDMQSSKRDRAEREGPRAFEREISGEATPQHYIRTSRSLDSIGVPNVPTQFLHKCTRNQLSKADTTSFELLCHFLPDYRLRLLLVHRSKYTFATDRSMSTMSVKIERKTYIMVCLLQNDKIGQPEAP